MAVEGAVDVVAMRFYWPEALMVEDEELDVRVLINEVDFNVRSVLAFAH